MDVGRRAHQILLARCYTNQSMEGSRDRATKSKVPLSVEQLALPCWAPCLAARDPCHQPNPPKLSTKPLRTKVTNPGPRFCRLTRRNVPDQACKRTQRTRPPKQRRQNKAKQFAEELQRKAVIKDTNHNHHHYHLSLSLE
jgi:hypothetical protein